MKFIPTETMKVFIENYVLPSNERKITKVCAATAKVLGRKDGVGMRVQFYNSWMRNPDFKAWFEAEKIRIISREIGELWHICRYYADKGSLGHMQLLLEHFGEYMPSLRVIEDTPDKAINMELRELLQRANIRIAATISSADASKDCPSVQLLQGVKEA